MSKCWYYICDADTLLIKINWLTAVYILRANAVYLPISSIELLDPRYQVLPNGYFEIKIELNYIQISRGCIYIYIYINIKLDVL